MAKPDGLLLVPPDGELEFLHPLPVDGCGASGKVTSAKLRARGISTVAEVAALSEAALVGMLGRASGRHLHALANGRDPRPVRSAGGGGRSARSGRWAAGRGRRRRSTRRSSRSPIGSAAAAHRAAGFRTVMLRLRFDDFTRATRSHTLPDATMHTGVILATARA